MTDSQKKNEILRLTLKVGKPCGPNRIREHLFPDVAYTQALKDTVVDLMFQMYSAKPNVAHFNLMPDGETITNNANTKPFLDEGGFEESERITIRARKKEKYDFLLSKWKVIVFWISILITVLAITYKSIEFIKSRNNQQKVKPKQQHNSTEAQIQLEDTAASTSKMDSLLVPFNSDK